MGYQQEPAGPLPDLERDIERLGNAIKECQVAQFRPQAHHFLEDPLSGREIFLNTARSQRHFETTRERELTAVHQCMYCNFQTPPTLFYVNRDRRVVFPDNRQALRRIRRFLNAQREDDLRQAATYYEMVRHIAPANRIEGDWLCRAFLNLTPVIVPEDKKNKENCFVVSGSPSGHYSDLSELAIADVDAAILVWQVLAAWSAREGLTFIPFYNGGRTVASGQSVFCFHLQAHAQTDKPRLFRDIKERWEKEDCPVCGLLKQARKYLVLRHGTFGVYVHPYPEHNFTWLVAEQDCRPKKAFQELDTVELAKALKSAAQLYPLLFGEIPAYNVLVRPAEHTGHFHAIFVPRTNTNVLAGFEYNTGMIVLTRDPRDVLKEAVKRLEGA